MKRLTGDFLISKNKHMYYDKRNYDFIVFERKNLSIKLNHKEFWRGAGVIQKMIERKRL